MRKLSILGLGAAVAVLAVTAIAVAARLDTYKVGATLRAGNETPKPAGVKAAAKGAFSGTYKENATGAVLTWKLAFSGLTGPATAAHVHMGKPGKAGPVIVPLCGPCKTGQKGTVKISKAVIKALEGKNAYVNVHTAMNQGGEIRGPVKVTG